MRWLGLQLSHKCFTEKNLPPACADKILVLACQIPSRLVPESESLAILRKWTMLERSQHPHTQNICGKRSIGNVFLCRKKLIFLTKNIFSQYFQIFSAPQGSEFQDLADPGCVRPYHYHKCIANAPTDCRFAKNEFSGSRTELLRTTRIARTL